MNKEQIVEHLLLTAAEAYEVAEPGPEVWSFTDDEIRRLLGGAVELALEHLIDLEVDRMMEEGIKHPLSPEENRRQLTMVIDWLRESAREMGDEKGLASLADPTEVLVDRIINERSSDDKDKV